MSSEPTFPGGDAGPTDERARIALQAALAMLVPLARWLVRNGVPYASFAPALKQTFVEAARRELTAHGGKITDSALSVLSGVHRRDIRAMESPTAEGAEPRSPSVASQLVTRWLTDPAWRTGDGQPLALPKTGEAPSFDALARQVSSDVHPRTLLAEMQRLGLVVQDGDTVRLQVQAFVPQQGFEEMATLLRDNVFDHLAAAAHNLNGHDDKFLEQSIFGSGLAPASTDRLGKLARKLWQQAFEQMAAEARPLIAQDARRHDAAMRMRFGAYYYAEPIDPDAHAEAATEPVRAVSSDRRPGEAAPARAAAVDTAPKKARKRPTTPSPRRSSR